MRNDSDREMADAATANGSAEHWSRLTDDHVKQMLRRGFKQRTIAQAGLWSALPEQATELLGFNPHSAGVVLPYRDPFTEQAILNRVQPNNPPLIGGKPAKYLSPKGAGNHLYFPPNCAELLQNPAIPIGLTEGEFKTLWAYQAGLFYVGLIGVWGWKGKNERGETGPIPDLDLIAWQDRIVTLAFDSDAVTNEKVRDALNALALELYRRGARIVYNIEIPPDVNGDKNGLDDFLHLNGVDEFLNLDAQEIPSPYPQAKVWSLAELRTANLERPAPVVSGWGIREKGKVILTGAGGRGKSVLLLQLACHLATGTPLLDHPQLTVTAPQRVLIYMSEDVLAEVRFRLLRQVEELGYGSEIEERIHILDFADRKPQVLTDEWALRVLADRIRQDRSTIAILDPFVSLHDRDENSNPQMRAVLDAIAPISEATGCTFIIAHHEPKAPENHSAASRGASAIRDWCRTMLRLTSHGNGDGDTTKYTLTLDKANYGGTVWSLPLERKQDSYIFTVVEEGTLTPMEVWEIIGSEERWKSDVLSDLRQKFNVSEPTARRAIEKALERGFIEEDEQANPDTGRGKKTLRRGHGKASSDME